VENKVSLWLFVKIQCHKKLRHFKLYSNDVTAVSLVWVTSVIVQSGIYTCTLYVTFPTLNDSMTDYQSQSPCRHAKTVLESLFVLCVYRPHDNGFGVASDKNRKSLLATPLRWMGQIRNPRWEQKRTEVTLSYLQATKPRICFLTRCKMVRSEVFSWVNWIHKQHIDFICTMRL
jgi:hypothetical protein